MSKNRENRIWQSSDGTWNRGFFDFVVTGPDDEWDVDYDHDRFFWIATGLPSEDAARAAWDGANPGGSQRVPWTKDNRSEIARYEKMVSAFRAADRQGSRPRGTRTRRSSPRKSRAQLEAEIRATLAKKKPYSW